MIKKSIIAVALSGIIAMNLISCTDFKDVLSKNSLRSDSNKAESYTLPKTLGDIKEKYADSEKVSYSEPYYNVSRDYVFEFKMKPEINSKIDYNPNDMYKVFADSNLTQETYAKVEYDYDKKVMKVSPPSSPIAQTEEEVKQGKSEANKNWGNVNTLYLARYYDEETGEKLDKPVITVFTIKGELDGELESSKVTRIKTDMSLNDQEFQDIVAKLNKKGIVTASNVKAGGYQFGVVYIELK